MVEAGMVAASCAPVDSFMEAALRVAMAVWCMGAALHMAAAVWCVAAAESHMAVAAWFMAVAVDTLAGIVRQPDAEIVSAMLAATAQKDFCLEGLPCKKLS
jgi:hypothetical protein